PSRNDDDECSPELFFKTRLRTGQFVIQSPACSMKSECPPSTCATPTTLRTQARFTNSSPLSQTQADLFHTVAKRRRLQKGSAPQLIAEGLGSFLSSPLAVSPRITSRAQPRLQGFAKRTGKAAPVGRAPLPCWSIQPDMEVVVSTQPPTPLRLHMNRRAIHNASTLGSRGHGDQFTDSASSVVGSPQPDSPLRQPSPLFSPPSYDVTPQYATTTLDQALTGDIVTPTTRWMATSRATEKSVRPSPESDQNSLPRSLTNSTSDSLSSTCTPGSERSWVSGDVFMASINTPLRRLSGSIPGLPRSIQRFQESPKSSKMFGTPNNHGSYLSLLQKQVAILEARLNTATRTNQQLWDELEQLRGSGNPAGMEISPKAIDSDALSTVTPLSPGALSAFPVSLEEYGDTVLGDSPGTPYCPFDTDDETPPTKDRLSMLRLITGVSIDSIQRYEDIVEYHCSQSYDSRTLRYALVPLDTGEVVQYDPLLTSEQMREQFPGAPEWASQSLCISVANLPKFYVKVMEEVLFTAKDRGHVTIT
ncbi:hypothetical protein IWQ62_003952, partial [Dispira parvispora]